MNKKLFLFLVVALGSCSASDVRLDIIEACINDDPKQALAELSEIDYSGLVKAKDKGLYSLLYSMALDKNYIDVASDSLIRSAVRYYSHHGDKYHKFLTYYYLGRVYENAQDYDEALSTFVKAESFLDPDGYPEYGTRLYGRKARIYIHQFASDRALAEAVKAKEISRRVKNPAYYVKSCLDVISLYSTAKRFDEAKEELDSLDAWQQKHGVKPQALFYSSLIRIALVSEKQDKDALADLYNKYIQSCQAEHKRIDYLLSAKVQNALGNYSDALVLLDKCAPLSPLPSFGNADFYFSRSEANEGVGNYKAALQDAHSYEAVVDSINYSVFNNDVRFLEERYKTEQYLRKARIIRVIMMTGLVLLIIAGLAAALSYVKRKKEYEAAIKDARAEFDYLKGLLNLSDKGNPDVDDLLTARLKALKPYLEDSGVGRKRPNNKALHKLVEDRKRMLESIGLMCSLTHPHFVAALARHKLTPEEIGICTLYVTDYSPKELPDILGRRSIYQKNSEIREKLADQVKDTTLPVWLRHLFKQEES